MADGAKHSYQASTCFPLCYHLAAITGANHFLLMGETSIELWWMQARLLAGKILLVACANTLSGYQFFLCGSGQPPFPRREMPLVRSFERVNPHQQNS